MTEANKHSDDAAFPLLINAMEATQNRFLNLCLQAFAFLLIGIGWVIGSISDDNAWCQGSNTLAISSVSGLFYGAFLVLLGRLKMKQTRLANAVTMATQASDTLIAHYRIDKVQWVLAALVIGALLAAFNVLVWRC